MRYFLTTDAARRYSSGGQSFEFEPIALRGGSWLGILEVQDETVANALAALGSPNVTEINATYFGELKKKSSANSPANPSGRTAVATNPALAVAERVGAPIDRTSASALPSVATPPPPPADGSPSVSLTTTRNAPPAEPLLVAEPRRKKFF